MRILDAPSAILLVSDQAHFRIVIWCCPSFLLASWLCFRLDLLWKGAHLLFPVADSVYPFEEILPALLPCGLHERLGSAVVLFADEKLGWVGERGRLVMGEVGLDE